MASQLEKMKKKGRAKEGLSQSARSNAVGMDSRYAAGNMMLINIDFLEANEKNAREISHNDAGIQSLKRSIADIGLQQNLVVYQVGGGEEKRFRLLSGHRRLCALRQLHEEHPDNEKFRLIPCMIVSLNGDAEKDISMDLEEQMYIAVTNVEIEGLSRKELLDSVQICMTYYEKKHAGEKKITGLVKEETAGKLGISQRMLYDILKIDGGLIPEFHKAYFEEERLQHRAARKLAGYSETVQNEIWKSNHDGIESLSEDRIDFLLNRPKEYKEKVKERTIVRQQPKTVFLTELNYSDIPESFRSDRLIEDETGMRVFVVPEVQRGKYLEISPEDDLDILLPENLKQGIRGLNRSDYKKYIKAMNIISKQMAYIAELLD